MPPARVSGSTTTWVPSRLDDRNTLATGRDGLVGIGPSLLVSQLIIRGLGGPALDRQHPAEAVERPAVLGKLGQVFEVDTLGSFQPPGLQVDRAEGVADGLQVIGWLASKCPMATS